MTIDEAINFLKVQDEAEQALDEWFRVNNFFNKLVDRLNADIEDINRTTGCYYGRYPNWKEWSFAHFSNNKPIASFFNMEDTEYFQLNMNIFQDIDSGIEMIIERGQASRKAESAKKMAAAERHRKAAEIQERETFERLKKKFGSGNILDS